MFQQYNKTTKQALQLPQKSKSINDPSLYQPSDDLVNAVNVALALGQPLLLTGEPGTGKTRLADHVAYIFDLGEPIIFNAQTGSTVKDLFYRYDALGHFQYSQTQKEPLTPQQVEAKFIRYQALGQAIKERRQRVVLLDEIDKAPRDLPNDVLAALENLTFDVPEIGQQFSVEESARPFIILTSNSEKNLPDAFLRRVTYYHIPFPSRENLLSILSAKVEAFDAKALAEVVDHFNMIRAGTKVKLKKNPATAELIYWAMLIKQLQFPVTKLRQLDQLSTAEVQQLATSYSVLGKNKEDLAALQRMIGQ